MAHRLSKQARKALRHPDVPGAGARARRRHVKNPQEKVGVVLEEFKRGTLRSGSGEKVTNRKQAIAIALSEARKAGARIPFKRRPHTRNMRGK